MTKTTLLEFLSAACVVALVACGGSAGKKESATNPLDNIPEPEPESGEIADDPNAVPEEPAKPEEPKAPEEPAGPEPEYSHGAFVWYELTTKKTDTAIKFYTKLFGWETAPGELAGMKFDFIKNGGREIGLIMKPDPKRKMPTQWMLYLSVGDVAEAVLNVKANGGKVLVEPTTIPEIGRFAVVADGDGAVFSLFKAQKGDQLDRSEGAGDWHWHELWAAAPGDAASFYTAVADYSSEQVTLGKEVTHRLVADEVTRASISKAPKAQKPKWIPFVLVDDVDAAVLKARKLKAKVRRKPFEIFEVGRAAVLLDPTGATFGVIAPKPTEEPEEK